MEGTISYMPTRAPTGEELIKHKENYLLLTPNLADWNPHTEDFKNQEFNMVDYNGNLKVNKRPKNHIISSALQLVSSLI